MIASNEEYFKANALVFQVHCNNLTFTVRLLSVVRNLSVSSLTFLGLLQEQSMETPNALEQRLDLLRFTLQTTQTLLQAVAVQTRMTSFAAGVKAEVAEEKARVAEALA